ncbi:hypothetical protein PG993_003030 [Apiospora rasikravindrae]|uniref:SMP domain-containing protein n=1 Tax=Apiospora rasikravindrae TaxID=990691 RepID=A0ABR1TY88_9PEZI
MPNNYITSNSKSGSSSSGNGQKTTQSSSNASWTAQAQAAGRRGAIAGVLDGTPGSLNYVSGYRNSSSAGTYGKK